MLSYLQSLILGSLQGCAELFPISSLGHSVVLPALLGWHIDESAPFFLTFLVATHFATALVLFLFFFKDWMRIIRGIFFSLKERDVGVNADARLGWLIIISTIPAGAIGILFENQIRTLFISAASAAFFLMLNGALLFGAELLRKRAPAAALSGTLASDARIADLPWQKGILVGALQALALIPGFSRTGASLAGGLMAGLSHEDALRFSFLLATPIIGAAALLKLPELAAVGGAAVSVSVVGALCAGLFAFLAVKFMTRYFSVRQRTLIPFALYCALAGAVSLVLIFSFR